MSHVLNHLSTSASAWSAESQLSFGSPHSAQNAQTAADSSANVGVLRFSSEGTELWIDEQNQVQCNVVPERTEGCSHSVPPSPTYGLRSTRAGRVHYCYTPGSTRNKKTLSQSGDRVAREDRGDLDKLASTHREGDHADACANGPRCCCSYLSDSQSSQRSTSATDTTTTTTTPIGSGHRPRCGAERRTSETSRCSCSSLSLAQDDAFQGCRSSEDCGHQEVQEAKTLKRQLKYNSSGPWDSSRRSESFHVEHSSRRIFSPKDSSDGSSRPPRAQTHDRLNSTRAGQSTEDSYRHDWPTPIPIKSGLNSRVTNNLTMDTISVFKYRINYPNLMRWTYHFMRLYSKWRTNGILLTGPTPSAYDDLSTFVHEVLKKRAEKAQQMVVDDEGRVSFRDSKSHYLGNGAADDSQVLKNQLWKRRYYVLLNAVDFVYKDYQLLHYVSKEGLFDCVSTPPSVPVSSFRPRGNYMPDVWPSRNDDVHKLATVGADPAGYLAERVAQVLVTSTDTCSPGPQQVPGGWPCLFHISVAFLSDVMAQSRILRSDLDRRMAVHDRLVYVLRQAREQRAKLKMHMLKQRELLDSLSVNLCALEKRLGSPGSSGLDLPSSIKDGLGTSVSSPFVECETVDLDCTHPHAKGSVSKNGQTAVSTRSAATATWHDWGRIDYARRRTEIHTEIASLERVLREEETRRKRLHNRIQELTGNIRVFCRLRPDDRSNLAGDLSGLSDQVAVQKHYLRVSSNDKLLFCQDTLKEQLQERKFMAQLMHHGARTVPTAGLNSGIASGVAAVPGVGGGGGYSVSANCVSPGTGGGGSSVGFLSSAGFGAPKCFIFDRVFGPRATQIEVYQEVDDLIVSCIDGYNVCIMAYGQTGSGKTYTMMGTEAEPGVNRRAVRSLFERCNRRKHWKYSIFVSIVEIYQEDVFDLLEEVDERTNFGQTVSNGGSTHNPSGSAVANSGKKSEGNLDSRKWKQHTHQPKQPAAPWNTWSAGRSRLSGGGAGSGSGGGSGSCSSGFGYLSGKPIRRRGSVRILSDQLDGVVLQNLHERSVQTETEMLHYLQLAERQRRVGSTRLNICSSRSHLVILLRVMGENQLHMTTSRGTLTLADLAGSENVTKSGSTGERFLEAACINKSLSSLGRVFDALRRQQKPTYRETKLTYLLRPNLSGDSKCLLFVALRTEPEHAEETWRAIHFGQGALQVVPGGVGLESNQTQSNKPLITVTTSSALLMSPATLLHSVRGGASGGGGASSSSTSTHNTKSHGKSKTGNGAVGYLPQSVYSMGPAITRRGWR